MFDWFVGCLLLTINAMTDVGLDPFDFQWSEEQLAVFARAERLRAYGVADTARDLVCQRCLFPSSFSSHVAVRATRCDVGRWYSAFIGREWDGSESSFNTARAQATRRRRALSLEVDVSIDGDGQVPLTTRTVAGVGSYRSCHLLVEPLDAHPCMQELLDYTEYVSWPVVYDVGRLEWNDMQGRSCCFCSALLLRTEAERVPGTLGCVCGKRCCKKGY